MINYYYHPRYLEKESPEKDFVSPMLEFEPAGAAGKVDVDGFVVKSGKG